MGSHSKLIFCFCLTALTACSTEFEQEGDARLVGEWVCSEPEVIKNNPNVSADFKYSFEGDGVNKLQWKMSSRGTLNQQIEVSYSFENLYRVEGTTLIEKEVSSDLSSYIINGEDVTGYDREGFVKFLEENIGIVSELELKFVSENEFIIDEATDNVMCKRAR